MLLYLCCSCSCRVREMPKALFKKPRKSLRRLSVIVWAANLPAAAAAAAAAGPRTKSSS